jgi:hypothetical protein
MEIEKALMPVKNFLLLVLYFALLPSGPVLACDDCAPVGESSVAEQPVIEKPEVELPLVELNETSIGWRQIEFKTRKFGIPASSVVTWAVMDTATSGVVWIDPAGIPAVEGEPVEAGEQILQVVYESRFLGKDYHTVVWMDPDSGEVLQYETSRGGSKSKHRIYRFTGRGAFRRTWYPANKAERELPWQQWTDRSSDYRSFQPEAFDQLVVDTLGLIYAIAASDLGRGSDEIRWLAYGNREISRAVFSTGGMVDLKVNLVVRDADGEKKCKGKVQALQLNLDIEQVGDVAEPDFGFLRDIEVLVDPKTRLPLLISGKTKSIGRIKIKARGADMVGAAVCPAAS